MLEQQRLAFYSRRNRPESFKRDKTHDPNHTPAITSAAALLVVSEPIDPPFASAESTKAWSPWLGKTLTRE